MTSQDWLLHAASATVLHILSVRVCVCSVFAWCRALILTSAERQSHSEQRWRRENGRRKKTKYDFLLIEFKSDANVKDDASSVKYGDPWAALWSLAASYSSLSLFYSIKTEMCHFQVHRRHKFRCVLVRCSSADSEFTLVKLCPCTCSGWTNSKNVAVRENAGRIILAGSIPIFTTFITLTDKKRRKTCRYYSHDPESFFSLWELAQQAYVIFKTPPGTYLV